MTLFLEVVSTFVKRIFVGTVMEKMGFITNIPVLTFSVCRISDIIKMF